MPVLSSKPYNAGDVVFKYKPLVFVVSNEFKGKHCDNCLKQSDQLKKCLKCLQMHYCGKDCQINDWKYHKNECKVFRREDFRLDMFGTQIWLLLRLYFRLKSDPTFATQTYQLMDGSDVSLNGIVVFKLKTPNHLKRQFDSYRDVFRAICQKISIDFDGKQLYQWFTIISLKSFLMVYYGESMDDYHHSVAQGLVIEMLPLRHSCLPNTSSMTKGLSVEIRAMKSISTGDEIQCSIIPLCMNGTDRQKQMNLLGIDCECDKCRYNLDKDIDYEDIEKLMAQLHLQWKYSSNPMVKSYNMNADIYLYLEAIHGEFAPKITYYLLNEFICLTTNSRSATKSLLKLWYKRVEKHLLVTHGSDHPWYALLLKYNPN